MSEVSTWSTLAASNNSPAPDGFPEGMNPSDVNDACREVMASIARWRATMTALQLSVDNIRIDGNTVSSTNTNGAINITPNGTGNTDIKNPVSGGVVIPTISSSNILTNKTIDGTTNTLNNLNASNLTSGTLANARVTSGNVTQHQGALSIAASQITGDGAGSGLDADLLDGQSGSFYQSASNLTSGTLPNARVTSGNVTQHQGLLSLSATQLTSGTLPNARVASGNVTQHQGSLSIAASQITGDGAGSGLDADLLDGKHAPTGAIVGTTDSQTLTAKTLTSPVINTSVSGTAVLDEDDMISNSSTKLATQQSIKAYVDAQVASPVPAVSGYVGGSVYYIHEDGGNSSVFGINAGITEGAWESVGPTGSGAGNIWAALNDVPANAASIRIGVNISFQAPSTSGSMSVDLFARQTGSTAIPNDITRVCRLGLPADTNLASTVFIVDIPLDASNRFDLQWAESNANIFLSIDACLKGFVV